MVDDLTTAITGNPYSAVTGAGLVTAILLPGPGEVRIAREVSQMRRAPNNIRPGALERFLKRHDFYIDGGNGGHMRFKHPRVVLQPGEQWPTIPDHPGDVNPNIVRQTMDFLARHAQEIFEKVTSH